MMRRRTLLAASLAAPAAIALGRPATAAELFPSLSVFVPAGPGGGWDGLGRAMEQASRAAGLVGTFQFENVGGAGGTVGLPRFVSQKRGRADALFIGGAVMVGAVLANRAPVGLKDVTPLARMTTEPGIIVVPASSEFRDIAGLMAAYRANPGAVATCGGSAGGIDHITLGLMLKTVGRSARDASYVAFAGGGPAQAALLGAQVKAGISGVSEFSEQVKAGRLRALATTGDTRSLDGVPTLKESGIDVVIGNWRGVFGAPGINPAQRAALVDYLTTLHASPQWQDIMTTRGWDDAFLKDEAFADFLRKDETDTLAVLREVGLVT
ncbi:putative tricarboxylic transport membrane protein [Humitalea rosea]|uniref:Putative tricarboxylic transport membrane protein n=1 Tax=Humitalea rosea TaxID=990373 RepID=A0A2W7KBJ5_9PROT|nr:tripartite tricarboxylate transporter substrate-binding protein [Humitalea rosea]PZW44994.1 putative tricarboxylic transport membrane protein [Humitalea rosea]